MIKLNKYLLLILIVVLTILFFYRIGQTTYINSPPSIDYNNLSTPPTSTPKPQIFKFIQEALKRNPRPTPPPDINQ